MKRGKTENAGQKRDSVGPTEPYMVTKGFPFRDAGTILHTSEYKKALSHVINTQIKIDFIYPVEPDVTSF